MDQEEPSKSTTLGLYSVISRDAADFTTAKATETALVVPDEEARDALIEQGYNVKTKAPRDEDEEPLMYLTIKVKPNGRGPRIYLVSGRSKRELPEESWGLIDQISIANVSLDIHAYDWTVNGKVGRSAYLAAMEVTQNIDRFAAAMEEEV